MPQNRRARSPPTPSGAQRRHNSHVPQPGAELLRATHEVGFFYLNGHGVDPQLTKSLLDVSREFFDLPAEQKLKLENIHSPQFRGYTPVGGELTANAVDWREQIDNGVDREPVPIAEGT